MATFSLESGKPIAYINGGIYDGKILHLLEDNTNNGNIMDNLDLIDDDFLRKKKKRLTYKELENLKYSIKSNKRPDQNYTVFDDAMGYINQNKNKELILYDGELIPIPTTEIDKTTGKEKAEAYFLSAPRDSGKSTFAGKFVKYYKRMFPQNNFYVISRVTEDPAYDELNPTRIKIDEKFVTEPYDVSEFEDSIVVFDDLDVRSKDKISEAVRKLRDELFENGRHKSTFVLACAHTLLNYRETKPLLSESSCVVIYPKAGYIQQVKRFLKEYVGVENKKMLLKILNVPSRWVMVRKRYPMYILHEKGAFLL
ncbi:MAG TPA: hypothetical protein VN703_00245 [Candidatus Sulfopaludibacter sp.]|nr:hypothetical protein [Candidatus Sulfopaludibacter sp.]